MVKWRSFFLGILYRRSYHGDGVKPGWSIKRQPRPYMWWCHLWTPSWHEGRGPYITIGLWWFGIYRGY